MLQVCHAELQKGGGHFVHERRLTFRLDCWAFPNTLSPTCNSYHASSYNSSTSKSYAQLSRVATFWRRNVEVPCCRMCTLLTQRCEQRRARSTPPHSPGAPRGFAASSAFLAPQRLANVDFRGPSSCRLCQLSPPDAKANAQLG